MIKGERVNVADVSGEVKRLMLEYQRFYVLNEKGVRIGEYLPKLPTRYPSSSDEQQSVPDSKLGKIMLELAKANGMTLEELEDLWVGDLP